MRRLLIAVALSFAALSGALAATTIMADREAALRHGEVRTASIARMIVAHGDEALQTSEAIIKNVLPAFERWNGKDERQGHELHAMLKAPVEGHGLISSAWILDANGISLMDT